MKLKKLPKLISAVLAVLLLVACTPTEPDVCGVLNELCAVFPEEAGKYILYSSYEHEGYTLADGDIVGRLYTGRFEPPSCFERIESYAVRLPLDDSGFEIHVIKCLNLSDTEELSDLLMRRIDSIRSSEIREYAPESYEKYFNSAEIYVKGKYVFLLATPDNYAVKRQIKRIL